MIGSISKVPERCVNSLGRDTGKDWFPMCTQCTFHNRTVEERFWAKVNKTDTCWLWTACTFSNGYGKFAIRHNYSRGAHRVAYELSRGPIPSGLSLDHLCRVTLCVRPDHLEAVTHRVNVLRGTSPSAISAVKTHCPQGHEYTEANTYRDKKGKRACRTCARVRAKTKAPSLTP